MKRWGIPDDWNAEEDGYISVLFCIPNSRKWRGLIVGIVESLSFGWSWDQDTGTVTDVQETGREVFESLMMGCLEELNVNIGRIATALEAGAQLSADMSALNDTLQSIDSRLTTNNLIYPDQNIADILMGGLIGRQLDLDFPWSGEGLADIVDEQTEQLHDDVTTLHERFTMADSSIFNPFGEKNITEALETLFRKDSLFDIEFLPNIATILDRSFNLYEKPEGILGPGEGEEEAIIEQNFKTFVVQLAKKLGVPQFLINKLETERINTAHLLMLIAQTLGNDEQAGSAIANALVNLDTSTVVNVINSNGCGCEGDCDCDETTIYNGPGEGDDQVIEVV